VIPVAIALAKSAAGAAWTLLRAIPWQAWVLALLCAMAWVYGNGRYAAGQAEVQGRWDADTAQANAYLADEAVKAANARADRYRLRAESQEAVAAQYLDQLNKANDRADTTADALRTGDLRFRKLWAQCQTVPPTGGATPGAGGPDDEADDRAASAGRIVRAAAECDAQVIALQTLLLADRVTTP